MGDILYSNYMISKEAQGIKFWGGLVAGVAENLQTKTLESKKNDEIVVHK